MRVSQITFDESGCVHLVVEIPDTQSFLTSEISRMPRILFRMFPYLASQRCYNDLDISFRQEAQATEIPHLFEHLLLEIQKQVRRGIVNQPPICGETQWNWTLDPRGRFHVTCGYDNEIVALASIRLAERIMRALDSRKVAEIDIDREIKRLRELAKASRRFIAPRREEAADYDEGYEEDSAMSATLPDPDGIAPFPMTSGAEDRILSKRSRRAKVDRSSTERSLVG